MAKKNNSGKVTAEDAYTELQKLIINGHFKAGERLMEEALAKTLNTSRTPVRQALIRATSVGLVVSLPNRGATVRAYTRKDLIDVYNLWAVLEGYGCYMAAQKLRSKDMTYLKKQNMAIENALKTLNYDDEQRINAYYKYNTNFHSRIIQVADNHHLSKIMQQEDNQLLQIRSYKWFSDKDWEASIFFHKLIINALEKREPLRAQNAMKEHIYKARDICLQFIDDGSVF